jgi:hypothetical protein
MRLSISRAIARTKLGSGLLGVITDAIGLEGTTNTFDALTKSIGTDAVTALDQLREATRGMVADADLMQAGNKFLAMGLADTSEGAAELAEVATQLGMAMGEDATASMENFALMMANQSIPRLDSFGISSGAVRERINELMETTEGMTREAAFNQAVMEQAAITMEKVGEQGGGAAGSMARIQTVIANLKTEIGQYFLPIAEKVLNWAGEALPKAIGFLAGLWDKLQARFVYMRAVWDQYLRPPLEMLQAAFARLMEALGINGEGFGEFGELVKKAFLALMELNIELWLNIVIAAINGLVMAIEAVVKVIDFFKQGWEAIKGLQLPDWLQRKSPSPIEQALANTADLMSDLSLQAIPQFQAAFAGMGNTDNRRNLTNYGGVTIVQTPGGGNPLEQLWELGAA